MKTLRDRGFVEDAGNLQERLFLALAEAEDAVSRLDEQVRLSPVARGWRTRLDFHEASAWAWSNNELASLEDLVLHDAQMDIRAPSQGLGLAHGLIRARRKSLVGGVNLMSPEGALWLAGRGPEPSHRKPAPGNRGARPEDLSLVEDLSRCLNAVSAGVTEGPRPALEDWCEVILALQGQAPALLVAAVGLETWRIINPLPREPFVGAILVAWWLTDRRRVTSHLMGLELAVRRQGPLPSRLAAEPPEARLLFHLQTLSAAGSLGSEELRRLALVRQLLTHQVAGRRKGSRAGDLAELLLANPVVSAPMAAERLGVSQQAVRSLIPTLGSSVRELTGRQRFQAWRV
jgi:hypothetical protein